MDTLPERRNETPRRSTSLERALVDRVMRARGAPPFTVVLWDGAEISPAGGESIARVRLTSPSTLRALALRPDPGLGEAYADGRILVEGDLQAVIDSAFGSGTATPSALHWLLDKVSRISRTTTRDAARRNIHHHYDLGNDFYRLWLDERMQYTCAFFPRPEASLEAAQLAKLDRVSRKLALRPGERVVEAGCGWGGLAMHMAERYGARVRAFNISEEQVAWAREQAERRGIASRVEFVLDDYRSIGGEYDAFVSVGMLEHVGRRSFRRFGRLIERVLAPNGRGLVHSIGRTQPQRMNAWLEQNVFPGAYIPSLGEMMAVFEPDRLAVLDVENLRLHYAKTLEHWLARFEKSVPEIEARYGAEFVRIWRLYLASSCASFRTGSCQLYQIVFTREATEPFAWSRDDLDLSACSAGGEALAAT